jgi:hypothetical protein
MLKKARKIRVIYTLYAVIVCYHIWINALKEKNCSFRRLSKFSFRIINQESVL